MQPSSRDPEQSRTYGRSAAVLGGQYRRFFGASIAAAMMLQVTIIMDTIFVGQLVGPVAMSGVRVASPIVNLLSVLATLVGVGGSTLASIAMGRRDRDGANEAFTTSILLSLALGAVFAAIVVPLAEPIARAISSSPETVPHTTAFMRVVAMGSPAYILTSTLALLLRSDSCIKLSSVVLAASGAVSAGLDLLFMGAMRMGVEGSALATDMGMLAGVLLALLYFRWPDRTLRLSRPAWAGATQMAASIFKNGAPSSLRMLFSCASLLFLNYVVGGVVGVEGITVLAVCGNIQLLAVGFFGAGGQAAMPIEGVLFGERDFGGLRLLVRYVLRVVLACVAVLVLVVWLFPSQIMGLFVRGGVAGSDWLVRLYVIGFVPMSVNYVLLYHFNVVQRRAMALSLIALENIVLYLPLIWVLTHALGLVGAVASFVCAEALTTALTLLVASVIRRREELASVLLVPAVPREVVLEASAPATAQAAVDLAHGVKGALDECGATASVSGRAAMGVEEMMVATARLNDGARTPVMFDVRVSRLPDCVQVTLRDNGRPFDPTVRDEATAPAASTPAVSAAAATAAATAAAPAAAPDAGPDAIDALLAIASSVDHRHTLRLNQTVIEIEEGVTHEQRVP